MHRSGSRLSLYLICLGFFSAGYFAGRAPTYFDRVPGWVLAAQAALLAAICIWAVRRHRAMIA